MTQRGLVIIDVQQEYFSGPLTIQYPRPSRFIESIAQAISTATTFHLPIALIRHTYPEQAPVFARESQGWAFHPTIEQHRQDNWCYSEKSIASALADPKIQEWIHTNDIDTLTLVGYMINNCVLGTAVDAERLGIRCEVIKEATGAIAMANEAGSTSAPVVYETLLTLLHSKWAAVASFEEWTAAVSNQVPLQGRDLLGTAAAGAAKYQP